MRYLTLAEALVIAEAVTGISSLTLAKASRLELLDSALHAPQAGFGDEDFYPDQYDKAAAGERHTTTGAATSSIYRDRTGQNVDSDADLDQPQGPKSGDLPGPTRHFFGADDGIRTRDPNLGKVVLYQLSHVRVSQGR